MQLVGPHWGLTDTNIFWKTYVLASFQDRPTTMPFSERHWRRWPIRMIKVLKIRSCKRLKVLLINTTEEEDDSRLLACNLSFNNVRAPSFFLFLVIWVPEWPLRKTPYVTFEIEINKLILLLLFFMLFLRSWTRNWLEMIRIKAFMVWVSYHTIEL